jgi:hypothetical protein
MGVGRGPPDGTPEIHHTPDDMHENQDSLRDGEITLSV